MSYLSAATRLIPNQVLAYIYKDWPAAQRAVLRSLISSPRTVYAALTMAHEEMNTITNVDDGLLRKHYLKIHMYFAEDDHWVGKQRDAVLRVLREQEASVKVVHGDQDIPHAFCISKSLTLHC